MTQEELACINSDAIEDTNWAKELIRETYFQFFAGLAAVVAMTVYPIVLQLNGVDFAGSGLNWGPSIVAALMGAALIFAWSMRFRNDKANRSKFDKMQLDGMRNMAAAFTKVNAEKGLSVVEVDTSTGTPQLVLRTAVSSASS